MGRNCPEIVHGKSTLIYHNKSALYQEIPLPFLAARYHSLITEKELLPDVLQVEAQNKGRVKLWRFDTRLCLHLGCSFILIAINRTRHHITEKFYYNMSSGDSVMLKAAIEKLILRENLILSMCKQPMQELITTDKSEQIAAFISLLSAKVKR